MDTLIKISGKPLTKLIEVVSAGIGTLYRPRAIRKEADAKAYEIKVIEKAKSEALAEGKLIEADNLDRINERLIAKELKRQNNIDDVVEVATIQLKDNTQVSDDIVDEDWSTRFFNIVQDVSDDEMKDFWGRILAGEIEQPKSYSIRTLELLRNISKEEANLFVKVSQFVLKQGDYFIYEGKDGNLSKFGISYDDIARLTEIGLLQAGTFVQKQYKTNPKDREYAIIYSKLVILLKVKANLAMITIPIVRLSLAGTELYKLIDTTPSIEYIKELSEGLKKNRVTVSYATINYVDDNGTINYRTPAIDL